MPIPAVLDIRGFRAFHPPRIGDSGRWRLSWSQAISEPLAFVVPQWSATVSVSGDGRESDRFIAEVANGSISVHSRPPRPIGSLLRLTGPPVITAGPLVPRTGRTSPSSAPDNDVGVTATVRRLRTVRLAYDYNESRGEPVRYQGKVGQWYGLGPVAGSEVTAELSEPPTELRHGALATSGGAMWQEFLLVDLD